MARPGERPESAGSTLNPDNFIENDRQLGSGHGTDALGPSDTSDTGSDIHGAPGLARQVYIEGLSTGTTSDPEESVAGYTDGPDIGDANLDSDSDSSGTGETATSARDQLASDGQDIDTDRIDTLGGIVDPAIDNDEAYPGEEEDRPPPVHKRH
ncbi:MAG: hypothetical protein V7606_844 [Burkholderiales bacterium]|jgi:hypothetical protein